MRIFLLALMLTTSIIGYGYYDAYSPQNVESVTRARIITAWGLYFDSVADFEPVDNSDLFISLTWSEPNNVQMVSGIKVNAKIFNGTELIDTINAPCKRDGSTWLARDSFDNGNTDLVCFVKINKQIPGYEGLKPVHDVAKNEADKLKLEYWVKVEGVNRPLQYIVWINNGLSKVYEQLISFSNFIKSPFQRS